MLSAGSIWRAAVRTPRLRRRPDRRGEICGDRTARFRSSGWLFPIFSTRWKNLFSYGQVRTEMRPFHSVQPYLSLRFIGDSSVGAPQMLSERSLILGLGVTTTSWRGIRAWAEAGSSLGYTKGRCSAGLSRRRLRFATRYGRVLRHDHRRHLCLAGSTTIFWFTISPASAASPVRCRSTGMPISRSMPSGSIGLIS